MPAAIQLAIEPASVMPSSRIWPSLRLGVRQQQLVVDRFVLLAFFRVDLELAEQGVHAEGAGLVGHDRHDTACRSLASRMRSRRIAVNTIVVDTARPDEPLARSSKTVEFGQRQRPPRAVRSRLGTEPPSARRRRIM